MSRIRLTLALSATALLAVPSLAGAGPAAAVKHKHGAGPAAAVKQKHNLKHTYPHAVKLCGAANKAKTPKKLAASAGEIKAACATLKTEYRAANKAFRETAAPLRKQAREAVKTMCAACKTARAAGDKAACKAARQTARTTIKGLREPLKAAAKTRHDAIETARKAFWAKVKALTAGSAVTPDAPAAPYSSPLPTV